MSLRLDSTKLEIRDASGNLIVGRGVKMIPVVQKVTASNVDVGFPNLSKQVQTIMNSGTTINNPAPGDRAWRAYAWGLAIAASEQSGFINLAPIAAGIAPNLILANASVARIADPNQAVFGDFLKAVPENVWLSVRSGLRLEYSAFHRRVAWLAIADEFLRLYWKQSTMGFFPNQLDPELAWDWNRKWVTIDRPPGYQLGSNYRTSTDIFPPSTMNPPATVTNAMDAVNFASTWRFHINAWLMQV